MPDPNMYTMYSWARSLPNKPRLPTSLWVPENRARFVNFIDTNFIAGTATWELTSQGRNKLFDKIVTQSASYMPDVADPTDRFVIAAVLWAACMDGAKTIRDKQVVNVIQTAEGQRIIEGPISDADRLDGSNHIQILASTDCLYKHGVEASPILRKIIRNQPIYYNGIPPGSILMEVLKPYL